MKVIKETEEYLLYEAKTAEQRSHCQYCADNFNNVTLWVNFKGQIDGMKVWKEKK